MANTSILAAFERMWQHVVAALGNKADKDALDEKVDKKGVSIDSYANLNSYTTIGKFYCDKDEDAAGFENCPTTQAFTMDVFYPDGIGEYVTQEIKPRDNSGRYYRQFFDLMKSLGDDWVSGSEYPIPASVKLMHDELKGQKPEGDGYTGTPDTSWYNTSDTEFTLYTAEELYGLAQIVNGEAANLSTDTFLGKTIKLGANIIINNGDASAWGENAPSYSWMPIGKSSANPFSGTLDGQGYYISGLYNVRSRDNGFMCWTINATIQNLAIINSYLENDAAESAKEGDAQVLGTFVGRGYGITLRNLYANTFLVCSAKDYHTGGIAGFAKSDDAQSGISCGLATVDSVVFDGNIQTNIGNAGNLVGGIVAGTDVSYVTIRNSLFSGSITTNDTMVGGIIGRISDKTVVNSCISIGDIDKMDGEAIGAIVGQIAGAGSFTISNCYYTQNLKLCGVQSTFINIHGNARLSAEDINNSSVPAEWVKEYDSENKPTIEEIGAAPAGYGYGDIPEMVYCNNDTDGTIFEDRLNQLLEGMVSGQTMQIRFCCQPHISGVTFIGTLWKHHPDYATLHGVSYDGSSIQKMLFDADWYPHEWVNPPIQLGVEYRTTERYNGKPVYCCMLNIGNLPDVGRLTVPHNLSATKIVRCNGVTSRGWTIPYIFDEYRADIGCSISTINVTTNANFSDVTASVTIYYTKD